MSYTVVQSIIPPRAPEMLVKGDGGTWNMVAPGLYPDETVVELSTGETIAVSVERQWLPNGAGIAFDGYARWLEADGSTKLSPNGLPVEAHCGSTIPTDQVNQYGADALATEVAMIVLGEPPKLTRNVPVDDGQPPMTTPIIAIADGSRVSASVITQIAMASASDSTAISL